MKILLRTDKQDAWKLVESAAYSAEAELQRLLAESPSLISLDEIHPGSEPLIAAVREFPLPIGSVDLLAFNMDGEIAVVECKLATNPEIKRKVIGQVLEYAAYLWQMSYEELDQKIKERSGKNLAELVAPGFSTPEDEENFRRNIENNLRTGNFILMIVVDEINEELARIVNYLNVCGNTYFAFAALEMRRFQNGEIEMLVPHVFGSQQPKVPASNGNLKKWSEETFFTTVSESQNKKTISLIQDIYHWSNQHASRIGFGSGSKAGSFSFYYMNMDKVTGSIFSVFTNGTICFNYGYMEKIFTKDQISLFRKRIEEAIGVEKMSSTPFYVTIELEKAFDTAGSLDRFKQIVIELKQELLQK